LNSTITSSDIKDSTITAADIASNTITAGDLASNAVNHDEIAANAVRESEIQDNAVRSGEIKDGEVKEADLNSAVFLRLMPTGSVMMWAGSSAPLGWLICDGSALSRSTYSTLYSTIGTAFGYTSSSNFRIPDLRGRFVRGVSGSSTNDPDRGSRTAMNSGGNTGNNVGSIQNDALRSHSHQFDSRKQRDTALSGGSNNSRGWDKNDSYETKNTATTGNNETRPKNAYLHYIIKH
jgi:microcystin-dependent protein